MALAMRIFVDGSCVSCASASECRECKGQAQSSLGWRRPIEHKVHVVEDYSTGPCHCGEIEVEKRPLP
jgi:hypothetical protein